jgi:maleylacetoacetate isomerase
MRRAHFPKLTLYDYFRSSACYRVRIALHLKGLEFNTIPVHLTKNGGEQYAYYSAINPQCLVPTLVTAQGILSQSLAIIEYLDETYPQPALLPEKAYEKALVRSFAMMIAMDVHPLNNLRVLNYLTQTFEIDEQKKNTWYQHWVHLGLAALEKQLEIHKLNTKFCFGNTPTLADICLIPQLYNAKRFHCDLSPYPNLTRIEKNCQALEAFQEAYPEETVVSA